MPLELLQNLLEQADVAALLPPVEGVIENGLAAIRLQSERREGVDKIILVMLVRLVASSMNGNRKQIGTVILADRLGEDLPRWNVVPINRGSQRFAA